MNLTWVSFSSVYNLIFNGQMESRNYNHPSVRRLRHARFHLFYRKGYFLA